MSDSKASEDRTASTLQLATKKLHAGSLLGKKAETNLNLLRVGPEYLSMVNQSMGKAVHAIENKHDAVFNGVRAN